MGAHFTTSGETAALFGVHEIRLRADAAGADPFEVDVRVTFTSPAGRAVRVFAFFDGGETWKARVYVSEQGEWNWRATTGEMGTFAAAGSSLRGMLRPHALNPSLWQTDDGQWFLNINDTAYLLFRPQEEDWQEYVRDAWAMGITSLRVSSFGGVDWGPQQRFPNCPWDGSLRPDLPRFRETDRRLCWLLDEYPGMYLQMILFGLAGWGKDSTGEAWFAIPEKTRRTMLRYMVARWAAFPQIFWLITNDMHLTEEYRQNQAFAREAGQYFAEHDPWQHLISCGPCRFMDFALLTPADREWVSYIHIEDAYHPHAARMHRYARYNMHVFLGEDRYEQDRPTRDPLYPAYYFRWMFWSWLLAGGSASYGGRWCAVHPYGRTGERAFISNWEPPDAHTWTNRLMGLDSVPFIKAYFAERRIDLAQFEPDDSRLADVGMTDEARRPKLARRGAVEFLAYHPNAAATGRESNVDSTRAVRMVLDLRFCPGEFSVEWFRARDGVALSVATVRGNSEVTLESPWVGEDVVVRVLRVD